MTEVIDTLLDYRSRLKEGYYMKIQVSYGGCLSFSISEKKDNHRYSEKIWKTLLTKECRVPTEESLTAFLAETETVIQKYIDRTLA